MHYSRLLTAMAVLGLALGTAGCGRSANDEAATGPIDSTTTDTTENTTGAPGYGSTDQTSPGMPPADPTMPPPETTETPSDQSTMPPTMPPADEPPPDTTDQDYGTTDQDLGPGTSEEDMMGPTGQSEDEMGMTPEEEPDTTGVE
jgi:hypothetical protein